jgi:hypothetical protein
VSEHYTHKENKAMGLNKILAVLRKMYSRVKPEVIFYNSLPDLLGRVSLTHVKGYKYNDAKL